MVQFQISYRKTGKETHESSKLEFFEKFLANPDAEGKTSGLLNKGVIADLLC